MQFIFRGDEIVAEKTDGKIIRLIRGYDLTASEADWARTYYHYASDEMGSITHMVEDGEVRNRYEYDAWGNLTVCEETVENRFRFNGQQYDPITQQYYLRARYYNPVIARFTQEDTYRGDGLNLYAYCRNNPVSYVDDQKEQVYQGLLKKEGLTADTVDPDTQLRLMAEAANQVRGKIITLDSTPELPNLSEGGTSTIHNDILDSPRTGSALKVDEIKPTYAVDPQTGRRYMVQEFPARAQAHGFNDIVDNYAGYATKSSLKNGTLYQLEGSLNGVPGRFKWIIQDGQVTHRMFIQNGSMNGVPIKP